MTDWARPADVDESPGGDTVKQAVLDNETCIIDVYSKLNILRRTHQGASAPSNPDEGQPWYDTDIETVKTYDGTNWNTMNARLMRGWCKRAAYAKNTTTELLLGPGAYHLKGGLGDKIVRWDASLTCTLTLASNAYRYVYLDDSVITSNEVIVASMIVDTATAPTWTPSLGGWYNGNDRCIFIVLANNDASAMEGFYHDGGEAIQFEGLTNPSKGTTGINSTAADATLSYVATGVVTKVVLVFDCIAYNADAVVAARCNGSTSGGIRVLGCESAVSVNNRAMMTIDSAAKIEWWEVSSDSSNTYAIWLEGFYLPKGM